MTRQEKVIKLRLLIERAMKLESEIVQVCEQLENGYEFLEYDDNGDLLDNGFNNRLERYLEEVDNYLTFGTYVEDNLYELLDRVDNEVQNDTNA